MNRDAVDEPCCIICGDSDRKKARRVRRELKRSEKLQNVEALSVVLEPKDDEAKQRLATAIAANEGKLRTRHKAANDRLLRQRAEAALADLKAASTRETRGQPSAAERLESGWPGWLRSAVNMVRTRTAEQAAGVSRELQALAGAAGLLGSWTDAVDRMLTRLGVQRRAAAVRGGQSGASGQQQEEATEGGHSPTATVVESPAV